MKKTLLAGILIFGASAFAANNTFKVEILQDSVIEGKAVKAGEYKISMENGNAVLKQGRQSIELPAREETAPDKVESTEITYRDGKDLEEIHFGGTRTKIVFDSAATPAQAGI